MVVGLVAYKQGRGWPVGWWCPATDQKGDEAASSTKELLV